MGKRSAIFLLSESFTAESRDAMRINEHRVDRRAKSLKRSIIRTRGDGRKRRLTSRPSDFSFHDANRGETVWGDIQSFRGGIYIHLGF